MSGLVSSIVTDMDQLATEITDQSMDNHKARVEEALALWPDGEPMPEEQRKEQERIYGPDTEPEDEAGDEVPDVDDLEYTKIHEAEYHLANVLRVVELVRTYRSSIEANQDMQDGVGCSRGGEEDLVDVTLVIPYRVAVDFIDDVGLVLKAALAEHTRHLESL